ncbi:MAG: DUF917 domain-containing protein [Clostridia bacterium]
MPSKKLTTRQEVEDFVRGCTFYATGGGGLPENGIKSLMSELDAGRMVGWSDISEIPDDALTVCPFLMGSIAPHNEATINEMKGFGMTKGVNPEKERLMKAIQELEIYTGKKFSVVVPIELAGANTPGPMAAGSVLGMITVDGDYTSRAIPEIVQITPNYKGKNCLPIASVDEWGNVCIIKESTSLRVAERIGKLISAAGYGLAGQAGIILTGKELKETVIPGTLTECYELGKFIREMREAGRNAVDEMVKMLGGWVLAKGEITAKDDSDKEGYYWGYVTIKGEHEYKGDTYKTWFKNENHIVWKNETPYVMSPDIISTVDLETGEPIPNPKIKVGQKVALIGMKCKPVLRCKECYEVLTPQYFGYDIPYIPIEEVMKKAETKK